jgi:hypothetical protein
MTEPRPADERLAQAFRALADAPEIEEVPEELRERIWLAVSGALPPEERRELVERTVTDPACAEAWRVATELWRASQSSAVDEAGAPSAPAAQWAPGWLAAAAVLLLGTTIVISLLNRAPGDEFRASSGFVVESLLPAESALPRAAFTLRWTPGPEGSRYQVRVTTEDLRVLTTAEDLTEAAFAVDPAVLAGLPAGAAVLWQVEASLPGGERRTSPTFVTRVE